MKQKRSINQQGQALITLLFFMVIAVTIMGASSLILATNIKSSSTNEQGLIAYSAAESGAEDGLLYLLRHPSTGTYTLPTYSLDDSQVSVTIDSTGTVKSIGTYNSTIRIVQIQTANTNGVISVTSWQEVNN